MKKFIATALLGVLSTACALSFTACGGNNDTEKDKEPTYTVTENEWKTAFGYFDMEWDYDKYQPVKADYPRINFSCNASYKEIYESEEILDEYKISMDFDKKAFLLEFSDNSGLAWKGEDNCYAVGFGWHLDEDTDKRIEFYEKEVISEEELSSGLEMNIYGYAGARQILTLELTDKYSEFTYSEEKAEYTATIDYTVHEGDYDEYDGPCDVTVKFKDGKITSLTLNYRSGSYAFEYTYGNTVTIPEFFINLELGETEKETEN